MDNKIKDPDDLLKNVGKSMVAKGIIIALIIHAVVIFGTSFSLYKDWRVYGVKTPSSIKAIKKAEKIEAEKKARDAEIARKAEAAAVAASNAVPVSAEAKASADKAEGTLGGDAADTEPAQQKKAPELEPLPPSDGFELDSSFGI